MKYFMKRVGAFLEDSLGLNQMTAEFKKFATMHCTYNLFQGLVSVYITTLLMRVSGDGDIVKWYNMLNFLFTGIMMILAVFVMRKKNTNLVTRIGIMGFIVLYTTLLFTMNSADKMMPVFGILTGFSNGFYWLTYSTYVSAFTLDSRRDVALAFIGFVNGIITLTMPALSGFVIEQIGGFLGYTVVFGLSFGIAVVTILLSLRLPKHVVPAEKKETNTYYRRALKKIVLDPCWRCGMSTEMIRGVREGTFNFLLNILVFETVKSETLMGFNTLLTGVGTIISFWVVGRISRPSNRIKLMFTATTVLLVAALLLVWGMSPELIIAFAFLNAFFNTFIVNPSSSIFFLLIQKKAEPNAREEYFSIKEVFLNFGRILGIFILLAFPKEQMGYVIAVIVLTLTQFITVGLGRHTTKLLAKADEEALSDNAESAQA